MIYIFQVKSPSCFWAQIRSPTSRKRLHKIKSTIEKIKNQSQPLEVIPDNGTLVIAPYQENNLKAYFRALVVGHISLPEILVHVFFIDYGYSSECRLCDLRRLEYNCDISDIPALAFECKLANIGPSGTRNYTDDWSQAACDLFWTLINKPDQLFGDIYSVVNSTVMVELIYKDENQDEISINQCLIEKKLAIKKEENYFSRFNHNLRLQHLDLSDEQCCHYEKLQYNQDYVSDIYPDPPAKTECSTRVNLRGPFSPLELELTHLVMAGGDKKVNIFLNSVNSVLLDTDPEDFSQRLLVAGSVSQSVNSRNLTLYNTTLMPRIPGLTVLFTLIFTPYMELRRNNFGTYYTGALCGLGFDPVTKISLFPEHDIELHFDVEITMSDLQFVSILSKIFFLFVYFVYFSICLLDKQTASLDEYWNAN